jgi:hypothetical protein
MCLIITGASNKIRSTLLNTNGLLGGIYTSNSDGIGIMYATTKGLKVVKVLPKSLPDAVHFITKLPNDDRNLAIHFRMTTHGDTDMTNCHPYDVIPGYVAMMHNGILHTGNTPDTSKSDTWHFIKDFLASPVSDHPPIIHNQSFLDMVAEFIGDNRFVFMDGEGKMSHVNYDQGIEHDGMWFSNTYAWQPSKLIPSYQYSTRYSSRHYPLYASGYDDDNDYGWDDKYGWKLDSKMDSHRTKLSAHDPAWNEADFELPDESPVDEFELTAQSLMELLDYSDVDTIADLLVGAGETTINILCNELSCELNRWTTTDDMSMGEASIYQSFVAGDTETLLRLIDADLHVRVAEVACYYVNWSYRITRPILPALLG